MAKQMGTKWITSSRSGQKVTKKDVKEMCEIYLRYLADGGKITKIPEGRAGGV